ncbi:hypothetical protein [Streptomyces scopuliridis]|uniref:hypothetical protein n=1 Tax=Streptomyces scopuliridis TaxID=452529 RepID=UPI00342CD044
MSATSTTLAEFQRGLIVTNPIDGLASVRALRPGRREPAEAHRGRGDARQRLDDEREKTVQQIADTAGDECDGCVISGTAA